MGAAHLNWAVPEGTAHVGGSRPPRWAIRPMRMGEVAKGGRMAPRVALGRSPCTLAHAPPLFWRKGSCLPPPPI